MTDKEKKQIIESLERAQETNSKSTLDDNPGLKRELLIGQLRSLKFGYFGRIKRKGIQNQELDAALDQYNKERERLVRNITKAGFQYIEGEEDDSKYKKYEM